MNKDWKKKKIQTKQTSPSHSVLPLLGSIAPEMVVIKYTRLIHKSHLHWPRQQRGMLGSVGQWPGENKLEPEHRAEARVTRGVAEPGQHLVPLWDRLALEGQTSVPPAQGSLCLGKVGGVLTSPGHPSSRLCRTVKATPLQAYPVSECVKTMSRWPSNRPSSQALGQWGKLLFVYYY